MVLFNEMFFEELKKMFFYGIAAKKISLWNLYCEECSRSITLLLNCQCQLWKVHMRWFISNRMGVDLAGRSQIQSADIIFLTGIRKRMEACLCLYAFMFQATVMRYRKTWTLKQDNAEAWAGNVDGVFVGLSNLDLSCISSITCLIPFSLRTHAC